MLHRRLPAGARSLQPRTPSLVVTSAVRWKNRKRSSRGSVGDPLLAFYVDAYGLSGVEEVPVIIQRMCEETRDERAGGGLGDELYGARVGTATMLQGLLSGDRGLPRNQVLKIAAALCDMAAGDILNSDEWAGVEAALSEAAARGGADWAAFGRLVVPCLGSLEARRAYVAELGGSVAGAPEADGGADILRGWVASRALWQLAFARCLATLLPNLRGPITVCDPALTAFDRRLIAACGCAVGHPGDDALWDDADGGGASGGGGEGGGGGGAADGTFVYAPYCPHTVNGAVVETHLGRLERLAYLGTCFEYYEAIDGLEAARRRREEGAGAAAGGAQQAAGGGGQQAADGSRGAPTDGGGRQAADAGGGGSAASCCCGGGEPGLEGLPSALLAALRRSGRVVEVPVPRLGLIHDVVMRLHVFKPSARGVGAL
ncbi:MAG: hypothetical protein J3K34DRAFT_517467 [Monoraphidium minutum]|nr:MAG: hypothetical protein J3K34DRAFT_517467 [Monoraphidium minutum]